MTERLVIRVALRDDAAGDFDRIPGQAAAGNGRGLRSKRARFWRIGGAVAVGLSIVAAAVSMIDVSGGGSIQGNAAGFEGRTSDREPVEPGGDDAIETAAVPVEPAAGPGLERESVSAESTPHPAATVARVDNGVDTGVKTLVRPSVAARKPVAKPATAEPHDRAAAASASPEETKAPATEPAIADPRVVRAQLSAGMNGKEPTVRLQPPLQVTGRDNRTIYFFSEVRDFEGQTLFHRWEREGSVLTTIPFEVRGERWRVYSNKTITPRLTGNWRVVLADSSGNELASSDFSVR
jgi:hypothetical protein